MENLSECNPRGHSGIQIRQAEEHRWMSHRDAQECWVDDDPR